MAEDLQDGLGHIDDEFGLPRHQTMSSAAGSSGAAAAASASAAARATRPPPPPGGVTGDGFADVLNQFRAMGVAFGGEWPFGVVFLGVQEPLGTES